MEGGIPPYLPNEMEMVYRNLITFFAAAMVCACAAVDEKDVQMPSGAAGDPMTKVVGLSEEVDGRTFLVKFDVPQDEASLKETGLRNGLSFSRLFRSTPGKEALEAEFGESITDTYVGGEWIWPVPSNGYISSGFGWRTLYGVRDNHIGIDISTGWVEGKWPYINGQPIVAANSGVVTKAQYGTTGYGRYIIIDHGGNNFTLYGHCSTLKVGVGDYVQQGQTIATVGSTGNSTGPHLHFEIRLNGTPVDPAPLVASTRPK